jgi:hypothetical protein
MEDLASIIIAVEGFLKLANTSATLLFIKLFLGFYSLVMFAGIVLLLVQRGLSGDYRETKLGMDIPPELVTKKGKLLKKWDNVRARMKSGRQSDYKVAIIEADNIMDDLIARMKYKGANMGERLDNINPGQIENIEDLRKAHEIRNRIIHDDKFVLTKEEAERTLGYFEDFLRYFQVLD